MKGNKYPNFNYGFYVTIEEIKKNQDFLNNSKIVQEKNIPAKISKRSQNLLLDKTTSKKQIIHETKNNIIIVQENYTTDVCTACVF